MGDKPKRTSTIHLYPPGNSEAIICKECTSVDTVNLPRGIMFRDHKGRHVNSTLPYLVYANEELL